MKRIYRTAESCGFNIFNWRLVMMSVPDTDYNSFCKDLVGLDESLVAAFVVSNGICGSHIRLDVPVLKEEDADRLSKQTATVMDIVKSNEGMFGQLGFVLVHHESVDGMFFPVDGSTTVLIGLMRPYDTDQIEQKVKAKVSSGLTGRAIGPT